MRVSSVSRDGASHNAPKGGFVGYGGATCFDSHMVCALGPRALDVRLVLRCSHAEFAEVEKVIVMSHTRNIIVIPARYGSGRFPGKPLALVCGKSLIERVWSIAKSVNGIDEVYIATDDVRIASHAAEFSARVIMTQVCENGTERIFQALKTLPYVPNLIINLQGDAVLTPPWVLESLLDAALQDTNVEIVTPATQITQAEYFMMQADKSKGEIGGTMVVFDQAHRALYFSKNMIPFMRAVPSGPLPLYRHIGLYAYRYPTLEQYVSLRPGFLERLEGLEQLRALENGIPVRIVCVDYRGHTCASVGSPEDVERVEAIIAREGELLTVQH